MKRVELLALVLVALAAMMLAAGCSGGTHGRQARMAASTSGNGTAPTRRTPPVSAVTSLRPLVGSFVMDLTWVSDRRGWALASARCARGLCPELARTADGGRTWRRLPAPPGWIQDGQVDCGKKACVTHVRFATASVGYLFGPALFMSRDGGRSWTREDSPPVESLEPASGSVVRVVYDHTGCPGPCHRTVEEAPAGSTVWRRLLRLGFPRADSREVAGPGNPRR